MSTNGENHNLRLTLGVVTTCLILAMISFVFRLYARLTTAAKLWYDDYWMCFVMLLCFAMTACDYAGLSFGSGQHQANLDRAKVLHFMKNLYAYMILWACGVFAVKVGILLFYWRVFPTRRFRVAVIGVFCLSAGIFAGNFFSFMLQCMPVSKFWDEATPGSCINQNAFYTASAIINVCGDVAVLFLPIPVVWGLHTSRNKKLSLSFLFLLGIFIFRIIAVKEINPLDFTFSNVGGGLWSSVEVEIGFICANLPAIRPLLSRWLGDGSSGNGSHSGYGGAYGNGGGGGGGGSSGYGLHSKIGASRTAGRMALGSKSGDRDVELMSQGNSSDEINLTKGGRPTSLHSESNGSHSDGVTGSSNAQSRQPGGRIMMANQGGGGGGGIRVKTEVQMTVDEWSQNDGKERGVKTYALPV
ncbi:integral membrane protein [Niveomyces insectorum RCEF 264]|uniref:Integral membrane protein n=1 Tax=Niveomyces insectorum RCEF 264 TaxID=1081102 RepID=A0A167UUB2_9HYPO|nr:integral membrane protein [Niveomyces insectorum RCEF 264]